MKKTLLLIACFSLFYSICFSQVYTEKKTRHRFAQLNLGLDIETNFGGRTSYLDNQGTLNSIQLSSSIRPRFVIGGTHFWGHADFYIAIPFSSSTQEQADQEIESLRGVETVFKYYPLRIEHKKLRPFVGVSIAPFYFEQSNQSIMFGDGPELYHTNLPIMGGFTFNLGNHLLELGVAWNPFHKQEYSIARDQIATVNTPPLYANISYRYMIETTLSAERLWESGETETITEKLANAKMLDGFFLGVGMSSAFWLGESSYNTAERPFLKSYGISVMPDFSLGYYFHQPDISIATGYRRYGTFTNAYGTLQSSNRRSFLLEATKVFGDYHGFVPFIGPCVSYENLVFRESFEGDLIHDIAENKFAYGLTFGWDIRPTRMENWLLRTNLRWYPNLQLQVEEDRKISFNTIEFNFIQLIVYPNRFFWKREKA
ncbi:MAG: hypothetical protein AAF806_17995 [Bacteroidota bacterium]